MRAGSAQEQMPTRITRSHDLFVDPGRDDAEDVDRLRDVLERALARALEHELRLDALGGGGAHHDLTGLGRAGEARRDVGGGPGGREGPALAAGPADLG